MYYVKIEGVNYEHADDKELTEEDVLDLALGNISEESNDSSKEPSSIAQYSTSQRTSYENNIGEISVRHIKMFSQIIRGWLVEDTRWGDDKGLW
ncbi:unnamed protein product [Rotaria socialis]|uniref:Uncharacterized protein n=1 Tax=Rotaria socialis TaxID=392032 RepID=A0A821UUC0_9BILA|nr:unnamed protein product [Rotaria socialis]